MLRLTETSKWDDDWFNALPPGDKLAWQYICDKCDNAGVWDRNITLATVHIFGQKALDPAYMEAYGIDWEEFFHRCAGRIEVIQKGKWWVCGLIPFQCKTHLSANPANKPHQKIIGLLQKHGLLRRFEREEYKVWGYSEFMRSVPHEMITSEENPPSTDELKLELESRSEPNIREKARDILDHLNAETKRTGKSKFTDSHIDAICMALRWVDGDANGIKLMITRQVRLWTGGDMEEYLQPSTLFRKQKFITYYDRRHDEVVNRKQLPPATEGEHGKGF